MEYLTGSQTAELVAEIYTTAGERIGPRLVESNLVLSLAGLRGHTEFYIGNPIDEDYLYIEKVNEVLNEKEMRFRPSPQTFISLIEKEETLIITLENLRGYERNSRATQIPGVTLFKRSNGFEGLRYWVLSTLDNLEKSRTEESLQCTRNEVNDIYFGIVKGYPDQAIYDLIEGIRSGRRNEWCSSLTPSMRLYKCAEPSFDFLPEHSLDPSIVTTMITWEKVLKEFYDSPWHKSISVNPDFIKAREKLC